MRSFILASCAAMGPLLACHGGPADHSAVTCEDTRYSSTEWEASVRTDTGDSGDAGLSPDECLQLCYSMFEVLSCGSVRRDGDLVLLECCGRERWY